MSRGGAAAFRWLFSGVGNRLKICVLLASTLAVSRERPLIATRASEPQRRAGRRIRRTERISRAGGESAGDGLRGPPAGALRVPAFSAVGNGGNSVRYRVEMSSKNSLSEMP